MKKEIVALCLLVAACRDDRPPAPSAKESAQLNEMDQALNAMANNTAGPADRSTGPANSSD